MMIWVVVIWPMRVVFGRAIGSQRFLELGYILLFIGIVLIGSGSAAFVIETLRKDLIR